MPDGTTTTLWEMAKYLWFAVIGLVVWNGKRLVKRVDEHEKNHIDKDTFNRTLHSLRADIKDSSREVRSDINSLHSRIDKLVDK